MMGVLHKLEKIGRFLEDSLLVGLLGFMVLLAGAQIILRNVFDSGFIWGDEMLRLLVLWVALVGASTASRADKHIKIDVLSRFLPERPGYVAKAVTALFTSGVCLMAGWYSWNFVSMEREFGAEIFAGVTAWPFQLVLPVCFFLISWRYLIRFFKEALYVVHPPEGGDPERVPEGERS